MALRAHEGCDSGKAGRGGGIDGLEARVFLHYQYLDMNWEDDLVTTNEVARLTAAYEFDAGKWLGRHRVAGLAERS